MPSTSTTVVTLANSLVMYNVPQAKTSSAWKMPPCVPILLTVISDLRYLKVGKSVHLEEARSELLEWLCQHGAIRTQKKQKVYHWNAVDFERLYEDAR